MLTVVLALVLVVVALFFVLRHKQYKDLPPYEPGVIPYLGYALEFGKNPLKVATALYKKHGEVFTIKVLGERITFLASPEGHKLFLKSSDKELDQTEPYKFAVPIFGPGVIYGCDLERRLQQVKFLRGSLKTDKMLSYVNPIIEEAEAYFGKWGEKGEIDLRDALSELIILTASRCLMGSEIRNTLFEEVAELFHDLDQGLTTLSLFWPNAPTPKHRKRDKARLEMARLFGGVMRERRKHPEVVHEDVLQMLMNATYRDGTELTEEEVGGLMIALLFAGQHTSSITSTWTGLLLLHHPKHLERVLEEQERVLKEEGELNYKSLQKMKYLENSIKEALRMYPPLIFLMRKLTVDKKFKNYTLPKGDTLFLSPALSGRIESIYKKPDEFNPERFLGEHPEDEKEFSW
eukprot:CAMPEP_0174251240 /NCGR_PEP_ID=MMETSP0439-20130205/1127_1 /TAXON_ID=0 /ORGANISM="Stereomyxa ramosa, Strain Chinc5" /LENGTH=404 /DNA_ID=CAMNT_0015331507 /DNA_START=45 /DNA_END=1256 /DNA_ORIENTATION=-